MINHSKGSPITSDTLLQRARWFGYRKSYFNDMKIFLSTTAKKFYENIEDLEKKIRLMYADDFKHDMGKKERIKSLFNNKYLKWTS